ncbi:MAG: DivIVA domain-containing protein [Pseudonocardiaceae bacterium]
MDRLDRKDLRTATFDVAMRGYDKRQVDERIRLLSGELAAAEHALRVAHARAGSLEAELHQLRSTGGGSGVRAEHHFGARVEKILLTAEEEAREIRSQAGAEAVTLLEQARVEAAEHRTRVAQEIAAQQTEAERLGKAAALEAEQLRQAATQEAEQLRNTATKEVDQLRTVAAKDVEEVRKASHGQAAQLVEQARIEADRLVAGAAESAGQRERASVQEMQRLSRLRDQVNAELYRAKNLLDGFFPVTAPAMAKGARDQATMVEPVAADTKPNNGSVRR